MFGNKEGSCDPLVQVNINGIKKTTEYANDTLWPIFNETLYFEFANVSTIELQQTVIEISLYDHNTLATNSFLGKFTVDAAFIYQMNSDHELYRKWVILSDTTDSTEGVKGYLRVTINVLGPGDRPPVHNEKKDLKIKNDPGESNIFSPGHIDKTGYLLKFNLYRAEHLPPMDLYNNKIDPYLSISFAGVNILSSVINDERNPEFNESLRIPFTSPCLNRKIKWEMWDADPGVDERVGTFIADFPDKEELRVKQELRWANMYGPLFGVTGEKADYMTKFSDAGK